MAKIKSTLDIVMERTRNLSMTDEDREALQRKELTDKVRGWVGMLVDRRYSLNDLMASYREEASRAPSLREILRRELLDHIDPDAHNESILEAWKEVLGLDGGVIMEAIGSYRQAMDQGMNDCRERIRSDLAGSGIAGSAVIPNVEADPECRALSLRMKERFRQSLQGR
jgi:hypothetical protein